MGPRDPPRDITLGQKRLIDMSDKLWSLPVSNYFNENNLGRILLHDQKKEFSYLKDQHTNALLNQILLLEFDKGNPEKNVPLLFHYS